MLNQENRNGDFSDLRLIRPALPETSLDEVDTSIELFGHHLSAPLLIEAMTGGTERGARINEALSSIASRLNIGFAAGSCSIVAEEPESLNSFAIARKVNKSGLVIANCSPTTPIPAIKKTVGATKADALQIHLNAVQEMSMKEGDRDFRWYEKIAQIKLQVSVPIIIKEVGFGLDRTSVKKLTQLGIRNFDTGGLGGTDFARIEAERGGDSSFVDLGLSTLESLYDLSDIPGITLIASGGIRTPLDAFKCLSLGAKAVGIAGPVLRILEAEGAEACEEWLRSFIEELRKLFCLYGCRKVSDSSKLEKVVTGDLESFVSQRVLRHG